MFWAFITCCASYTLPNRLLNYFFYHSGLLFFGRPWSQQSRKCWSAIQEMCSLHVFVFHSTSWPTHADYKSTRRNQGKITSQKIAFTNYIHINMQTKYAKCTRYSHRNDWITLILDSEANQRLRRVQGIRSEYPGTSKGTSPLSQSNKRPLTILVFLQPSIPSNPPRRAHMEFWYFWRNRFLQTPRGQYIWNLGYFLKDPIPSNSQRRVLMKFVVFLKDSVPSNSPRRAHMFTFCVNRWVQVHINRTQCVVTNII